MTPGMTPYHIKMTVFTGCYPHLLYMYGFMVSFIDNVSTTVSFPAG